jgi:hypothetical protein
VRGLTLALLLAGLTLAISSPARADGPGDLTVGLVSCWDMEEESGVRADSWGDNDLTANNNPGYAAGVVGNALNLVTANSQSLSSDSGDLSSGQLTLSLFFKPISNPTASINRALAGRYSTNNNQRAYQLGHISTGIRFNVSSDGSSFSTVESNFTLSIDTWYFLAGRVSGNDLKLFVDANSFSISSTIAANTNSTAPFMVGTRPDLVTFADAYIDNLVFWNIALSDDQITWIRNDGAGRSCADIIATGDAEPEPTPTPPPGSFTLPGYVYTVELPSGNEAAVQMTATAGDSIIAALILILVAATLFETARRMARAGSAR